LAASLAQADGRLAWPFFIRRSSGQLQTALQYLQYVPAFEGDEVRADLLRRLARDFNGKVLWFGSSPAFISVDADRSRIVEASDLFGACCCRNARHIELDVA
jgi:hypothetical protein